MNVCPSSSKELCQCKHSDYSPEYIKKHGRYSWDTEENIGYTSVQFTLSDGSSITSKIWGQQTHNVNLLKKIYELERLLQRKCRDIIQLADKQGVDIYNELIQNYTRKFSKRFHENSYEPLKLKNITPMFIHQCLQLFTETTHTIQELDPNDPNFMAVNKPKNTNYQKTRVPIGADQKLRSLHRHVVIKLSDSDSSDSSSDSDDETLCLFIHELAHTPPNHVCFRPDDHNHDFRIFQALFLQIAKKNGFIQQTIFV
jgi:hypothetical protein